MRLYINYETTDEPWGGINSFIRSFKEYVYSNRKDIELLPDMDAKTDLFFMSASYYAPGKEISTDYIKQIIKNRKKIYNKIFKKNQIKIIHRLDGLRAIYNGEFIPNDQLQIDLSHLADRIIFQSKFSLENFQKYGEYNKYTIINNGVNQDIFNSNGKQFYKNGKLKILSSSWSTSLNKGFQTIADFSENPEIESIFVGRWNETIGKKNVKIIPPSNRYELAKLYKEADVFLFPAKNDPCPNVVLEAMSCGLPVIYNNSGGTPELASSYGIPLPQEINTDSIDHLIESIKKKYDEIVPKILNDNKRFSIATIAERYLDYFRKVLKNEN
ncbi:MAG: glycosyltransferase [Spirochaetota bacterium]